MTQPTDRPGIDQLTSDQLDQLYREIDTLRAVCQSNKQAYVGAVKSAWAAEGHAKQAEATLATVAAIFEGFGNLLATSSRDWGTYRVDAWLYAVVLGWDCEEAEHDDTCIHGTLEEMAAAFGWSEEAVAKARRYRATVRAVLDQHGQTPKETT